MSVANSVRLTSAGLTIKTETRGSLEVPSWTPSPKSPNQALVAGLKYFLTVSLSVEVLAFPAIEIQSPLVGSRKEMLT